MKKRKDDGSMPHLANINGVESFEVTIEFTNRYTLSSRESLPFVSLIKEIMFNVSPPDARYPWRIPYSAPLYLWELQNNKGKLLYIGQTVYQQIRKRFKRHSAVMKILKHYPPSSVYFRLCSRLDLKYKKDGKNIVRAIEHFPLGQAKKLIDDIEAYLIYRCKPQYNIQYKNREKQYWKPFLITKTLNVHIPYLIKTKGISGG